MKHLEDLPLEEFYFFLKGFWNRDLVEVSEKLDGSFVLSFGFDDTGKLWFSRGPKSKRIFRTPEDLPKTWQWNGYRCAIQAITEKRRYFADKCGAGPGVNIHCEILYGKRPNTIKYKEGNYIVFLYNTGGGHPKLYHHFTDIGNSVFDLNLYDVTGRPYLKKEHWRFTRKRLVKKFEEFDLTGLDSKYQELKSMAGTRDTWPKWSETKKRKIHEKKKDIRMFLVDRVVRQIHPSIGGDAVEGIVLTKLSHKMAGGQVRGNIFIPEYKAELHIRSAAMTKIVDPDFTELNQRYWKYAELCRNGTKIDGKWEKGIFMRFKSWLAELTGVKLIHSIGYKAKIDKNGGIDKYIEKKELDQNHDVYTGRFKILCTKALKALEFLEQMYWKERSSYPQEIKDRTDFEFMQLNQKLRELRLREENVTLKRLLEIMYDF